jgi:hypothetical protein
MAVGCTSLAEDEAAYPAYPFVEFYQIMGDKHVETQCCHRRLLRVGILRNVVLAASLLFFLLTYLRYSGE